MMLCTCLKMQHQLDKDIRWYCKKDNGKNAKANKA